MKHIIMFSGGIGSWMAAKRVAAQYGTEDMILLFADTLIEDEDNYRFINDAQQNIGAPLVRLCDGRTPWQVFHDVRFLGNARIAPCSRILKQEQCHAYVSENYDPKETIVYIGIDWSEKHRMKSVEAGWLPYAAQAPLCNPPWLTKSMMLFAAQEEGLDPPRLYAMGYPHANCGGFCVRAGQQSFATLLREMPDRYAHHEAEEEALRKYLGKNIAIMTDRRGGGRRPLTMREFRERTQTGQQCEMDGFGGCGCFTENDNPEGNDE